MKPLTEGMRLIVCGGRDFKDAARVFRLLAALKPSLVIQGGAKGADEDARIWADRYGAALITVHALWLWNGKAAGPKRNQLMLDLGIAEGLLAFPGGRGTADMIRRARKAGLPVLDLSEPAGEGGGA